MKTFTTVLSNYKTISRDSSTGNATLGKQLLTDFIREILYAEDWTFNRGTSTDKTVASQQYYPLPYNCWRLRKTSVEVSSTTYNPRDIKDEREWAILNRVSMESDVPTNYFIKPSSNEIGYFPIPSEDNNTITHTFQKRVPDYGATDYDTGTIVATNGSTAVVGTSTVWTSDMAGRWLNVDNYWYEIASVTDNTHLTLVTEYGEDTASGSTYTIAEMIPLPEGFENIPLYKALSVYFQSRDTAGSRQQANQYITLYEEGLSRLYKRDGKTTGDILTQSRVEAQDPNNWPTLT